MTSEYRHMAWEIIDLFTEFLEDHDFTGPYGSISDMDFTRLEDRITYALCDHVFACYGTGSRVKVKGQEIGATVVELSGKMRKLEYDSSPPDPRVWWDIADLETFKK